MNQGRIIARGPSLFDRVITEGTHTTKGHLPTPDGIEDAVTYHIQNVQDYYELHYMRPHYTGEARRNAPLTFPNCAPPHDRFWMEFTAETLEDNSIEQLRYGVYFVAIRRDDVQHEHDNPTYQGFLDRLRDVWAQALAHAQQDPTDEEPTRRAYRIVVDHWLALLEKDNNWSQQQTIEVAASVSFALAEIGLMPIKWVLVALPMFESNGVVVFPQCNYVIPVLETGAIIDMITYCGVDTAEFFASKAAQEYGDMDVTETITQMLEALRDRCIYPCLLSLSFLHCRNVTSELEPAPTLTRQQRRSGVKPPIRFHVLNIDPVRKVLREKGDIEHTGIHKALHICRGHFAHYTEDKPLFGKFVGIVWRPDHVRGSLDEGIVDKEYKVKATKGKTL